MDLRHIFCLICRPTKSTLSLSFLTLAMLSTVRQVSKYLEQRKMVKYFTDTIFPALIFASSPRHSANKYQTGAH